jgi:hypothetical protein
MDFGGCFQRAGWLSHWCGVFGELYGSAVESRFAKDLPELVDWVAGDGPEPTTVTDANFAESRLVGLRTRNSAAYKGLFALIMRDGCLEFQSGEPIDVQSYFAQDLDLHHVFPKRWCKLEGIPPKQYDSAVNKTAIAASTNRKIGGRAPSEYVPTLERDAKVDRGRMDEILASHVIEPSLLRGDDFAGFFEARRVALLTRIERAMGKPALRDQAQTPQSIEELL